MEVVVVKYLRSGYSFVLRDIVLDFQGEVVTLDGIRYIRRSMSVAERKFYCGEDLNFFPCNLIEAI